jgi:hypothetical protein
MQGLSWQVIRTQEDYLRPAFALAAKRNPALAEKYTGLAKLLAAPNTSAQKAVATKKANKKNAADGKPPTHGGVGKAAQRKAQKAAYAAQQAAEEGAKGAPVVAPPSPPTAPVAPVSVVAPVAATPVPVAPGNGTAPVAGPSNSGAGHWAALGGGVGFLAGRQAREEPGPAPQRTRAGKAHRAGASRDEGALPVGLHRRQHRPARRARERRRFSSEAVHAGVADSQGAGGVQRADARRGQWGPDKAATSAATSALVANRRRSTPACVLRSRP